jgi:phage gp46-like protein
MDYAITIEDGLTGAMEFTAAIGISNNVFLSLAVERGSFFHNPGFGLRKRERLKNTEATAALIRHDYREALQWLIDTGRARSVEVEVERDRSQDLGRLAILVTVIQTDGASVSFSIFQEVV